MNPGTPWYILAAILFTIAGISALGEWVFHWWDDPFQYVAVGGSIAGFLSLLTAASRSGLHDLGERIERRFDRSDQRHHRLVEGQDRLVEGQDRLVEGQGRLVEGQDRLVEGQREQTALLREVVVSFRRGPGGP